MFRFALIHSLCGTLAYRVTEHDDEMSEMLIDDKRPAYTGARFTDATESAGLDASKAESSFGANLVDVDNDGDLDLYIAQGEHTNRLFLNMDGQGHFVESTDESGLFDPGASRGGMFADFNGDGNVDLYQLGGANVPNRLYFGDGASHFIRQFVTGLEDDLGSGHQPCLGDVNGDGDIDIFYLNADQSNTLFLNTGSGEFRNGTEAAGLTSSADASAFHCQFADMDGDGDLDLFVSNSKAKNAYYVNDGTGQFVDRAEEAGLAGNDQTSTALIIGDFNGDGHLDLFTNSVGANFLYINDGTGSFTDQTEAAGLGNVGFATLSVNAADFDGDGDLDIVQGRIEFGYSLYENDGNGMFTDVSRVSGINRFHGFSHAIAVGDVDGDGDLDVYLNSWDFAFNIATNNRLLIQEGEPAYNWLKVRPVKEHGYPAFVGAQVRLFVAGTMTPASIRRHADGGHSFGAQDSGDVYFGLGQFPGSNFDIEVRCGGPWITKATQPSLGDVAPNQIVQAICSTA